MNRSTSLAIAVPALGTVGIGALTAIARDGSGSWTARPAEAEATRVEPRSERGGETPRNVADADVEGRSSRRRSTSDRAVRMAEIDASGDGTPTL